MTSLINTLLRSFSAVRKSQRPGIQCTHDLVMFSDYSYDARGSTCIVADLEEVNVCRQIEHFMNDGKFPLDICTYVGEESSYSFLRRCSTPIKQRVCSHVVLDAARQMLGGRLRPFWRVVRTTNSLSYSLKSLSASENASAVRQWFEDIRNVDNIVAKKAWGTVYMIDLKHFCAEQVSQSRILRQTPSRFPRYMEYSKPGGGSC